MTSTTCPRRPSAVVAAELHRYRSTHDPRARDRWSLFVREVLVSLEEELGAALQAEHAAALTAEAAAESAQDTVDRLAEQLRYAIQDRAHGDEIAELRAELRTARAALPKPWACALYMTRVKQARAYRCGCVYRSTSDPLNDRRGWVPGSLIRVAACAAADIR